MPLAGAKILASDQVGAVSAIASAGNLTVTTSLQDVPGASIDITTAAGAKVFVTGIFDIGTDGSSDVFTGRLLVDGAAETPQAIAAFTGRVTLAQTWVVQLGAGTHTLKLSAAKVGTSNTLTVRGTHTTISAVGPLS